MWKTIHHQTDKFDKSEYADKTSLYTEPWEEYIQPPTQFGQIIFEQKTRDLGSYDSYPKL